MKVGLPIGSMVGNLAIFQWLEILQCSRVCLFTFIWVVPRLTDILKHAGAPSGHRAHQPRRCCRWMVPVPRAQPVHRAPGSFVLRTVMLLSCMCTCKGSHAISQTHMGRGAGLGGVHPVASAWVGSSSGTWSSSTATGDAWGTTSSGAPDAPCLRRWTGSPGTGRCPGKRPPHSWTGAGLPRGFSSPHMAQHGYGKLAHRPFACQALCAACSRLGA